MTVRRYAGLLSIAAVFALGAVAARAVAARHPSAIAVDFAQPLVVVTAWGGYGALCFTVLAATAGCAALCLFALVRAEAWARAPAPAAAVALAAAAALATAGAWTFVFSSDVYAYAAYGSLAAGGLDPYVPVGRALHGPLVDAARWQWGGTFPACIYGPAFVALARVAVAATAGLPSAATLLLLRILAAGAFVACVFVLDAALGTWPAAARNRALVAFGLNPVALWSVAEGHNDAFVLLGALLGFVAIRRGRPAIGALLIGLTPLVKATGAAFALGLALDTVFFASRSSRRVLAALAAGFAVALGLALPPLVPALRAARQGGHYAPSASVQGALGLGPTALLVLAAAAYGVIRLRDRQRDGHAWLGIAVWLALPNPYPWYALWFAPAAVAAGGGAAGAALYGVTISSLVRYLPDVFGHIDAVGSRAAAAVEALPLLLVLARFPRPFLIRKTTSRT